MYYLTNEDHVIINEATSWFKELSDKSSKLPHVTHVDMLREIIHRSIKEVAKNHEHMSNLNDFKLEDVTVTYTPKGFEVTILGVSKLIRGLYDGTICYILQWIDLDDSLKFGENKLGLSF